MAPHLVPTKTLGRTKLFGSNNGAEFNDCNALSNNFGMDVLDAWNPITQIYITTDTVTGMVQALQVSYRGTDVWTLRDGLQAPQNRIDLGTAEIITSVTGKVGPNSYYGVDTVTELSFTIYDQVKAKERVEGPYGTIDTHLTYQSFEVKQQIFAFGGYQAPYERTQNSKIIGFYFLVQGDSPGPFNPGSGDTDPRSATFSTTEYHDLQHPAHDTRKAITLAPPRQSYTQLPRVVDGLTMLDIGGHHNIRVKSLIESVDKDQFVANIHTWGDTQLYGGAINCLDIPYGGEIQGGRVPFQCMGCCENVGQRIDVNVLFENKFDAIPKVICWLTGLDMDKNYNWRINMFNPSVTRTGFSINVGTWGDSVLNGIGISWLAVPADAQDVVIGHCKGVSDKQSGDTSFEHELPGVPYVLWGLSGIDFGNGHDLRVKTSVEKITKKGFKYNIDTSGDSAMFSARINYIAIASRDK